MPSADALYFHLTAPSARLDRMELTGARPDVDDAVRNGSGRLDRVAGVVGPQELERRRHRGRRRAVQGSRAAKLRPRVLRARTLGADGACAESPATDRNTQRPTMKKPAPSPRDWRRSTDFRLTTSRRRPTGDSRQATPVHLLGAAGAA